MSGNIFLNDIRAVLRGLECVTTATVQLQKTELQKVWQNSNIRSVLEDKSISLESCLKATTQDGIKKSMSEVFERSSVVFEGMKTYATYSGGPIVTPVQEAPEGVSPEDLKISELNYKDKELIKKLEREHELKLKREKEAEKIVKTDLADIRKAAAEVAPSTEPAEPQRMEMPQPVAKKFEVSRQTLNPEAKQRKVPSTRIGRMVSFGSLAAGLGMGTVAEVTRRTLGMIQPSDKDTPASLDTVFLTEANAERIVNTLCKVRGAALKIGQILSIQDNTVISPGLQKAFERVRQSADFMPTWQVHKKLVAEFGSDWHDKVFSFNEQPFAAASIGQVHLVVLKDGREAAMKIQYPGVAAGIESDINNLVGILKLWNIFPEGLFIDNLVEVAKRELAWEVDYQREAECTKKFRTLLAPYKEYVVPEVVDELCTQQVFTTVLIDGLPVDKCVSLDRSHREHVARLVMQLCLRELFEFQYMQTDPNWSNFLYIPNTGQLALLDFGASRSYEKAFIDEYIDVIKAAADKDRQKVLEISRKMGFLTGYETKSMENAHVDAVMILAEVFSSEEAFDFGQQDTTLRIQKLVPTIVAERLCPPPEEIYSLHRKLSGVFLLCAKLKVKISCRDMFLDMYHKYKKRHS